MMTKHKNPKLCFGKILEDYKTMVIIIISSLLNVIPYKYFIQNFTVFV